MSDPAGFVDYYSLIEDAIGDLLKQELSDILKKDFQVTDNESDMQRGADYYILFRPGSIPPTDAAFNTQKFVDLEWTVIANLFTRFATQKVQWPQFKHFRALVWWVLKSKPFLPQVGNVRRISSISAPDDATYWKFIGTSESTQPDMMTQALRIIVQQRIMFTR